MQTFNGGDTATVRYRKLKKDKATVFVEEETTNGNSDHPGLEDVGYLALYKGYPVVGVAPK